MVEAKIVGMSHPDPNGPPDLRPFQVGDVLENPVTRERAALVELPRNNPEGRSVAELTALVGARVVGEHRHPTLVERFTVLEGELTVKKNGKIGLLRKGESATIEPNVWHDWWNAANVDARVRVEVTPGERFGHMIETLFGLARMGHTNAQGLPHPLQLAVFALEFRDVFELKSPPPFLQTMIFGALAPIARWQGYCATYPQLSRSVLAPRS